MAEISALDPKELVLVVIALVGLVPLLRHYRPEAKWFAAGYGLLVVGAVATNLEALVLGSVFDLVEHGVGLMGSGLLFAAAAYYRRKEVLADEAEEVT